MRHQFVCAVHRHRAPPHGGDPHLHTHTRTHIEEQGMYHGSGQGGRQRDAGLERDAHFVSLGTFALCDAMLNVMGQRREMEEQLRAREAGLAPTPKMDAQHDHDRTFGRGLPIPAEWRAGRRRSPPRSAGGRSRSPRPNDRDAHHLTRDGRSKHSYRQNQQKSWQHGARVARGGHQQRQGGMQRMNARRPPIPESSRRQDANAHVGVAHVRVVDVDKEADVARGSAADTSGSREDANAPDWRALEGQGLRHEREQRRNALLHDNRRGGQRGRPYQSRGRGGHRGGRGGGVGYRIRHEHQRGGGGPYGGVAGADWRFGIPEDDPADICQPENLSGAPGARIYTRPCYTRPGVGDRREGEK